MVDGPSDNQGPVCFFSYFRDDADVDDHMEQFWQELQVHLAERGAVRIAEASFRDRSDLTAGDDWEQDIVDALASSRVFVAMYTPRYFHRFDKPCYCGKEFQAFLQRSGGDRAKANIVPVLWVVPGKGALGSKNFPPTSVKWVNCELETDASKAWRTIYEEEGLKRLKTRKGRKAYEHIRDDIVDLVLRKAASPPAPAHSVPGFGVVPCAFHDEDEEADSFPQASPDAITPGGGPKRIVLLYASDGEKLDPQIVEARIQRCAFASRYFPQPLLWRIDAGLPSLQATVMAASAWNQIPLVVVSARLLGRPGVRSTLEQLMALPNWTGGIIIIGGDPPPLAGQPGVHVQALTGDRRAMWEQLSRAIALIRAPMNKTASVVRTPDTEGPGALPLL